MKLVKHTLLSLKTRLTLIIDIVLKIGSFIIDFATKCSTETRQKKNEIAKDLLQISEILEQMGDSFDKAECSYLNCSALSVLAKSLVNKIQDSLDKDMVMLLTENMELLEKMRSSPEVCEDKKKSSKDLKMAAGRFFAASLMVKY